MPAVSALLNTPILSKADIVKFNQSRLYLQVLTLSDLVDSSERSITSDAWAGNKSSCRSTLQWPKQSRLCQSSWTICRRILAYLYTIRKRSPHLRPEHRVKEWYPAGPSHQLWPPPPLLDPLTNTFYCRLHQDPSLFSPYRCTVHLHFAPISNQFLDTLPPSSVPVTVTSWIPHPQIQAYHSRLPVIPPTTSIPSTISEYLKFLPACELYYLGIVSFPTNISSFLADLLDSNFDIATNGSVREPNGSFSWIIHGLQSGNQLKGCNTTAPTAIPLSSFRTECCGYLGALHAL